MTEVGLMEEDTEGENSWSEQRDIIREMLERLPLFILPVSSLPLHLEGQCKRGVNFGVVEVKVVLISIRLM